MTPEAQRLTTYAERLLREAYRASRRGEAEQALAHAERAAAMLRHAKRLDPPPRFLELIGAEKEARCSDTGWQRPREVPEQQEMRYCERSLSPP